MILVKVVGLMVWATGLLLTVLGSRLSVNRKRRGAPHLDAPFGLFPISVLKPLKNVDSGLERNLESFFRLRYPTFELIFTVVNPQDPAIDVVERLMRRYPRVQARLLISSDRQSPNPKVSNMLAGYDVATHPWILISDSNIRVRRDYLKQMAAHIDADVGIVTSTVTGIEAFEWGGHLESLTLDTFYQRGMDLALSFDRPCVLGKSMLFKKSQMDRFGGLKSLGCYLAEDHMAGEAMKKLGLKTVISAEAVTQYLGSFTMSEFWLRQLRWGRLRKAQAPVIFALEPLQMPLLSGLFGAAYLALAGLSAWPWIFVAQMAVSALCDYQLIHRASPLKSWRFTHVWLMKEFLALPLWFHTALGSSVQWRGQTLTIRRGGLLNSSDLP